MWKHNILCIIYSMTFRNIKVFYITLLSELSMKTTLQDLGILNIICGSIVLSILKCSLPINIFSQYKVCSLSTSVVGLIFSNYKIRGNAPLPIFPISKRIFWYFVDLDNDNCALFSFLAILPLYFLMALL